MRRIADAKLPQDLFHRYPLRLQYISFPKLADGLFRSVFFSGHDCLLFDP